MSKFDALCLSGGGIYGICQLGALHRYIEDGALDLKSIQEYSGTSVGSIIGLLLVCGWKPLEVFERVYSAERLIEKPSIHNVMRLIKTMGFTKIDNVIQIVKDMVKEKMGYIPTLNELYIATGKKLFICCANVSQMKEVKLCHISHPNLSCIDAVKMSCNLPFVFQRIKYNGDYIVDGGLMNNFPWNYHSPQMKRILGIVISGEEYTFSDEFFIGYFYRLIKLPIRHITNIQCINAPSYMKLIEINGDGISLSFNLSKEEKMRMFIKGSNEAKFYNNFEDIYVEHWNV